MNASLIQLLVLAAIAIFLILKLRSVLGTREGFEKPPAPLADTRPRAKFEVIEGGPDRDISDNTSDPATSSALAAMKGVAHRPRKDRRRGRGQPDCHHPPARGLDLWPPHGHGRSELATRRHRRLGPGDAW